VVIEGVALEVMAQAEGRCWLSVRHVAAEERETPA